jgi:hypothetical protein
MEQLVVLTIIVITSILTVPKEIQAEVLQARPFNNLEDESEQT